MKKKIQHALNNTADYLEIAISSLVIVIIVIAFIGLVQNFGFFMVNKQDTEAFTTSLGSIMNIVIGIEFLKMLTKHNLSSVVEVLMFAIARKLLIDHPNIKEYLIGVIAITVLLVARKFLFIQGLDDKK
jgi:uncharacterized membrane protein (DUF373 family)